MNERCDSSGCRKLAKYEERHVARGHEGYWCEEHRKPRGKGYASYKLESDQCPALMPDGMLCDKPAKWSVHRPFSGVDSVCCGTHRPSTRAQSQGVTVQPLGRIGA